MNKKRRKNLSALGHDLRAIETRLDEILSEEQSARDNLPENLEEGDVAQDMDWWIDILENWQNSLSDLIAELDNDLLDDFKG
jgi:hypothetical protein